MAVSSASRSEPAGSSSLRPPPAAAHTTGMASNEACGSSRCKTDDMKPIKMLLDKMTLNDWSHCDDSKPIKVNSPEHIPATPMGEADDAMTLEDALNILQDTAYLSDVDSDGNIAVPGDWESEEEEDYEDKENSIDAEGRESQEIEVIVLDDDSNSSNATHLTLQHADMRLYKCDICKKSFECSDALTKHKHLHKSDFPFQCSKCMKPFLHAATYSIHMLHCTFKNSIDAEGRESQEINVIVLDDDSNSSNASNLTRQHADVCLYKCDICTKTFECNNALNKHKYMHKKDVPFQCSKSLKPVLCAAKCSRQTLDCTFKETEGADGNSQSSQNPSVDSDDSLESATSATAMVAAQIEHHATKTNRQDLHVVAVAESNQLDSAPIVTEAASVPAGTTNSAPVASNSTLCCLRQLQLAKPAGTSPSQGIQYSASCAAVNDELHWSSDIQEGAGPSAESPEFQHGASCSQNALSLVPLCKLVPAQSKSNTRNIQTSSIDSSSHVHNSPGRTSTVADNLQQQSLSTSAIFQPNRRTPTFEFSAEQRRILEKEFETNQCPSRARCLRISQATSLKERQVQKWFEKRRLKCRRERESDTSATYPPNMSTRTFKFSVEQRRVLEREFEADRYLSQSRHLRITKATGLTERQVTDWFKYRRRKWRKENTKKAAVQENQESSMVSDVSVVVGRSREMDPFADLVEPLSESRPEQKVCLSFDSSHVRKFPTVTDNLQQLTLPTSATFAPNRGTGRTEVSTFFTGQTAFALRGSPVVK